MSYDATRFLTGLFGDGTDEAGPPEDPPADPTPPESEPLTTAAGDHQPADPALPPETGQADLLEAVDPPPPCQACRSLELWQDAGGRWRCLRCEPPVTSRRLLREADRIRRETPIRNKEIEPIGRPPRRPVAIRPIRRSGRTCNHANPRLWRRESPRRGRAKVVCSACGGFVGYVAGDAWTPPAS